MSKLRDHIVQYEPPSLESCDQIVVFAMVANPEPYNIITILDGDSSIMDTDTNTPHPPNLLEMQGRMAGGRFEQVVILIGKLLNLLGK